MSVWNGVSDYPRSCFEQFRIDEYARLAKLRQENNDRHKLFSENVQARQTALDADYAASTHERPARKIVCRHCGKGPLDGVALRKIGWTWSCMQHKLRARL